MGMIQKLIITDGGLVFLADRNGDIPGGDPVTAIVGATAVSGGLSYLGSRQQSKGISAAGDASAQAQMYSADVQKEMLEKSIQSQMDMYYKGLQMQEPWRYAGGQALESLQRELYGKDYMAPWAENFAAPYPSQSGLTRREGVTIGDDGTRGIDSGLTGREGVRSFPLPQSPAPPQPGEFVGEYMWDEGRREWWNSRTGAYDILPGQRPPASMYDDGTGTLYPEERVARTMSGGVDPNRGLRGGVSTTYPSTGLTPYYQHAPQVTPEGSPLYQMQLQEGSESINRQLASRGLWNSGAGVEALSDYTRRLLATDAMRQQGLMETLAGYGQGTSQAALSASMQLGGGLASAYSGAGANISNSLMQAGQNRAQLSLAGGQNQANMYTNLANLGMGGLNSYMQFQGMNRGLQQYYSPLGSGGLSSGDYMYNLPGGY